jgi:Uma2 family endonuclease
VGLAPNQPVEMIATFRLPVTDDDLVRASADNPGWQIERDPSGALVVSPTSSEDGARSGEVLRQLANWAHGGGGKVFDSSTGFKMPDGAVLSPDAAWISPESLAALSPERRGTFWEIAPDVVIEVCSKSDDWSRVKAKIRDYAGYGSRYALAIDPKSRETFALGAPPEGLALDITSICDA